MCGINSVCVTCLSNADNGVSMPSTIGEFLQNILHFKSAMQIGLPNLVCLSCYRTLSEIKRFYVQLQDVQHYFDQTVAKNNDKITQSELINNTRSMTPPNEKDFETEITYNDTRLNDIVSEIEEIDTNGETKEEFYEDLVVKPEPSTTLNVNIDYISYRCEKCCRIFEEAESYKKHLEWHIVHETTVGKVQKEKRFECGTCRKELGTSAERRAHDVIHTDLIPFKCGVCTKTFRQLSELSVHRTVHFRKRGECADCGKRFSTKFELVRHLNVHKNEINK